MATVIFAHFGASTLGLVLRTQWPATFVATCSIFFRFIRFLNWDQLSQFSPRSRPFLRCVSRCEGAQFWQGARRESHPDDECPRCTLPSPLLLLYKVRAGASWVQLGLEMAPWLQVLQTLVLSYSYLSWWNFRIRWSRQVFWIKYMITSNNWMSMCSLMISDYVKCVPNVSFLCKSASTLPSRHS